MPVCTEVPFPAFFESEEATPEFHVSDPNCIEIGLINNMPSAAMEATERQFRALLDAAADGIVVRLSFSSLPEVPRSDEHRRHMTNCYSPVAEIWNRHLDAVIVTGTEPLTQNLRDEPYWRTLTRLLDWADFNTYSSVWSCLAAHAAVRHFDGIERRRLRQKLSGVFAGSGVSDDPLTRGCPGRLWMPHSRCNDISQIALEECGYRIVTSSRGAGVGAFRKELNSLFVFFQGHPEYEADSLLLEYRRDIRRFLRGERDEYPHIPRGCFDKDDVARLRMLKLRALSDRREELLADFPLALLAHKARNSWLPCAIRMYRNWLREISGRKAAHLRCIRRPAAMQRLATSA